MNFIPKFFSILQNNEQFFSKKVKSIPILEIKSSNLNEESQK